MSEKIISLSNGGEVVTVIFLIVLGVLALVSIVSSILMYYFKKKKESFEKEEIEERNEYIKERRELNTPLASESQEISDRIEQLDLQHEQESEEIKEDIQKYKKRVDIIDLITEPVKVLLQLLAIFVFMIMLIMVNNMGADVSAIRPLETTGNGVEATAYYVVDYNYVDQDTLTVFVKNNSTQILDQAIVQEVNTGKTGVIESIEPGQEKIVTIDVYPNSDNNYDFEINDIQFK